MSNAVYDRSREARDQIVEWAPDREQGVVKVGEMVVQRAEMHAGITADEAEASWQERRAFARLKLDRLTELSEAKRVELDIANLSAESEATYRAWAAVRYAQPGAPDDVLLRLDQEKNAAQAALGDAIDKHRSYEQGLELEGARRDFAFVEAGRDPISREHLASLAGGYSKALAEVRATGGQMTWDARSNKKAMAQFNTAAQVYPTEWVEASNGRPAPITKTSTARAHYVDRKTVKEKKSVQVVRNVLYPEGQDPNEGQTGQYSLGYEYVPNPDVSTNAEGKVVWARRQYEVFSPYRHRMKDDKPVGRGWVEVEYQNDEARFVKTWRRPETRMEVISRSSAPELTVSSRPSVVGDDGYDVAVHELSHRYEASVPMIGRMESEFLTRRTTTDGQRDRPVRYAKGEITRPDAFTEAYMGKDYSSAIHHEVLSCGTQGMFGGGFGGFVGVGKYKRDDETRAFILGVMATARPSRA